MAAGFVWGGAVRAARAWLVLAVVLSAGTGAAAGAPGDASFRLFLKDGTTIACFGEYARAGGRVVFSVPIGGVAGQARLQLLTLPEGDVDWPRTEQYADAVRYARYAATRGEADYAVLMGKVAEGLRSLAATTDPVARLAIVQRLRRDVAGWPRAHYGYRAGEVREILSLLEEAASELRASAGARDFDLNLVATIAPPDTPLLPDPTPAETVAQVLIAARHADVPAERLSLLRTLAGAIDDWASVLPPRDLDRLRHAARDALDSELAVERAYADLVRKATGDATRRAADADVKGVERVLRSVARDDARLGRRRPDHVRALVAVLEAKLDAARRLRLARDRWALVAAAGRRYQKRIAGALGEFRRVQPSLQDIRTLAGPDPRTLRSLEGRVASIAARLADVAPPPELRAVHALLASAVQMAVQAVRVRGEAARANDVALAWNASAAAAGSMMLLGRASAELADLLTPPELR